MSTNVGLYDVIFRKMGNFRPFWPPIWPLGLPQKDKKNCGISKMVDTIEFLMWNNVYVQICSWWCSFLGRLAVFDHFDPHLTLIWPLELAQYGQKLWYVENGWHHRISHEKLHDCANFQLLVVISRGMGNCWLFWPPFDPWGAPKGVKKWSMTKITFTI